MACWKIGRTHIKAGVCEVNQDTLTFREREATNSLVYQGDTYIIVRDVQGIEKNNSRWTPRNDGLIPTQRELLAHRQAGLCLLTHSLIDVTLQCRVLGISSTELLHNIRHINVEIHDINNCYIMAAILAIFIDWEDRKLTLG